jgi:transposase
MHTNETNKISDKAQAGTVVGGADSARESSQRRTRAGPFGFLTPRGFGARTQREDGPRKHTSERE